MTLNFSLTNMQLNYVCQIQPNKTKEGLQFIWDTVPNSDDPRNPLSCQGGGGFSATAIIACDPNAAVESMSIDSVSKISCKFNIKMRSEAACKPKPFVPIPIANNDEPWGWFSILFYPFHRIFTLLYVGHSLHVSSKRLRRNSTQKLLGAKFFRCKSCCMSIIGRSSDGGGTTSYNEFGTSNASSSNMNSRFSNTYNPARHENTVVYDDFIIKARCVYCS